MNLKLFDIFKIRNINLILNNIWFVSIKKSQYRVLKILYIDFFVLIHYIENNIVNYMNFNYCKGRLS